MFRIPSFYEDAPTFDEAWTTMTNFGRGDCLTGMEAMNRCWEEHLAGRFDDDDEFFEHYQYEVNAYNVVYAGMKPLFVDAYYDANELDDDCASNESIF